MKKVKSVEIQTIEGKSLQIPETDSEGVIILDDQGNKKMKNSTLRELLRLLVFSLPPDKITMKDSIEAHRFFDQLAKSTDGVMELEDAEYDWIKQKVEDYGPRFIGISAVMVKEALDDYERLHEPAKEKAKK